MGRRFGQHFLARASILERIAEAACEPETPRVIEIGPGRGALTEYLLKRARRVAAIEVDPVLVHYLRQKFRDEIADGRLELIEGDVLQTDLAGLTSMAYGGEAAPVAGNLPYYITSPILEKVFAARDAWSKAVFLVQAEVAERLAAGPGGRDFGYLSVLAQVRAHVKLLFPVPRAAFRPPPKVDSAVVALTPRDAAKDFGITDVGAFLKFASACFRQKRKTLRNNLAVIYDKVLVDELPEAGRRAEQLSIAELASIAERLRRAGLSSR